MRHLLVLLVALPLAAQQPQQPPSSQAPKQEAPPAQAAKPEEAKPAEAQESKPAQEAAAPAVEQAVSGSIDVGYRFVSNVRGDFNTYRSVINLGEGPKLFGADLTFLPTNIRLADRIDIHASSWGGDPYNTARIEMRKTGLYDFRFDYRNVAYFNFLPSYADPSKERGIFLNQRSFDSFIRMSDFQLDLFPGSRIVPYVAYTRSGRRGRGITDFVLQGNEYPVPDRLSDFSNEYRAGLRFEFSRWHLTLEGGGLGFRDDQEVFGGSAFPNLGNRTTPFLGQQLTFTGGYQAYGVRGDGPFTRALFTANPVSWLNLYGQFLYSQPSTKTHFNGSATGNILNVVTLYSGQLSVIDARAKQPHPSGSFGFELRPAGRIRLVENITTDRLHDAASAFVLNQFLLTGAAPTTAQLATADRLVMNYNRQEFNVLFDLASWLTLRGGHRFVWGDSTAPPALVLEDFGRERAELRRNVALAGVTLRTPVRFRVNLDYEGSPGDRAYFRTSLNDYQRGRAQARYQVVSSLLLTAQFNVLSNKNPVPTSDYHFLSRESSFGVNWTPGNSKYVTVLADYMRSSLRSSITYLIPSTLDRDLSFYRDNAHTGTALVDFKLPTGRAITPHLSLGGSAFKSSGSRPTKFYEPLAKLGLASRHVEAYWQWNFYELAEPFYNYEGFRTHTNIAGLRFLM